MNMEEKASGTNGVRVGIPPSMVDLHQQYQMTSPSLSLQECLTSIGTRRGRVKAINEFHINSKLS
jgi:hypothetical protein